MAIDLFFSSRAEDDRIGGYIAFIGVAGAGCTVHLTAQRKRVAASNLEAAVGLGIAGSQEVLPIRREDPVGCPSLHHLLRDRALQRRESERERGTISRC